MSYVDALNVNGEECGKECDLNEEIRDKTNSGQNAAFLS